MKRHNDKGLHREHCSSDLSEKDPAFGGGGLHSGRKCCGAAAPGCRDAEGMIDAYLIWSADCVESVL